MAKNKNKQVNNAGAPVAGPVGQKPQAMKKTVAQPDKAKFAGSWKMHALVVGAILVVCWVFLKVCLNNQFTNWDDPGYVKDNALIKSMSGEGLKNIFSTSIMGNYHPLTILTYAIDYSYDRLQPWCFHLDSLLWHLADTVLVYWLVLLLSRRWIAAAVAALLFGLHPMHMESVAWVAGRKDVVYGVFYLGACIAYLYFIRATKGSGAKWYVLSVLLFVCSLLAKPVAVTLPLTLLLLDLFEDRKSDDMGWWMSRSGFGINKIVSNSKWQIYIGWFAEKMPFFLIALGFGIKSVLDQRTFGSLGTQTVVYNFIERIGLGGYAMVTYLWKAAVPVGLACFYPYPVKDFHDTISPVYYLYPAGIIVVLFLLWRYARTNKVVLFGTLFFLVNIVLLLQFIPVGGAIVADRYSYIPYLGLFFIAGWYVSALFEVGQNRQLGYAVVVGLAFYSGWLGYQSSERCKVWYDTSSLWRDEIEKEPVRAPNAYNNLGFFYFNKYSEEVRPEPRKIYHDSAKYLLNMAIHLQSTFVNPYISLGELERTEGNFPLAKQYYFKALSLKADEEDANAYLGLAIIYAISRQFDSSEHCFKMALQFKPYFPEAVSNYGNFLDMTGKHEEAIVQYGKAIAQNPDMYAPYLNRGRALQRLRRTDEAMRDIEKGLELNPDMGELYYARAFCYAQKGDKAKALADVQKAVSLGFREVDRNFYAAMGGR